MDIKSALKGVNSIKKPEVISKDKINIKSGWDFLNTGLSSKPVEKWNKKDLIKYWFDIYSFKYGSPPGVYSSLPLNYQHLETVKFMLEKALNVDELENKYFKIFIDWIISENIPSVYLTSGKSFNLSYFKDAKYGVMFKNFLNKNYQLVKEETPTVKDINVNQKIIKLEDLDDAFSIHSQYFIENYGTILVAYYLFKFKKLNKEDCLLYIEKAIKRSDINKVNDSIKKYSPYPEEIIIDKNLVSSYVFNTGTNNILKEIM